MFIEEAVRMANTKEAHGTDEWSLAFLAAMNWLMFKVGERQLLKSELTEAIEMYGEIPTVDKWRGHETQNT